MLGARHRLTMVAIVQLLAATRVWCYVAATVAAESRLHRADRSSIWNVFGSSQLAHLKFKTSCGVKSIELLNGFCGCCLSHTWRYWRPINFVDRFVHGIGILRAATVQVIEWIIFRVVGCSTIRDGIICGRTKQIFLFIIIYNFLQT